MDGPTTPTPPPTTHATAPPNAAAPDLDRLARWLQDGRIRVYPRRPADRRALLEHVVARALEPGTEVGEPALNERLRRFTDDPATLRRYLVDHRLLDRSPDGSVYRLPRHPTS